MYNTPSLGISRAPIILSESTGGGECRRLPYTGISLLEYQPSDIVIDRTRDIAIVPSNHQITAIKLSSGDDHPVHPVHVVSEVAGSDFEGIVSVGDVLYAVSENSMLYAFEWEEEGRLETIGSWQLDGTVKASEGIAHRSDNDGNEQLLISSFDDLTQVSLIHVFDVPSSSSPSKLSPLYHLNDKLMGDGLLNAKIGAVQVFEDALYVLYDNARAIRVFDLTTGAMTSEMTLPRVGRSNGAFDKQFEGMFLERRVHDASSLSSSLLRGSSNGDNNDQILLHLALDTPPEIWTFVMKEEEDYEASGTMYSFPQCAAAE